MVTETLRESQPNLGNDNLVYVHCPSCSRMYESINEKGSRATIPAECERCGCPMVAGEESQAWMDLLAEEHYDPALADLGRKIRGEGTDFTEERARMRVEIEAEVRAEIAAEAAAE